MFRDLRRRLTALALPEGAVVALAALVWGWQALRSPVAGVLPAWPAVVLVAGLLLAWRFGRPHTAAMLLLLAFADRALHHVGHEAVVRPAVALLLPLDFLLAASLPLRRATAPAALGLAGAVLVQVVLVLVLRDPAFADLAAGLAAPLLPALPAGWTAVPPPALLAFVAAAALFGTRAVLHPDAEGRGRLWALVAAFLAMHAAAAPAAPGAFPPPASLSTSTWWFSTAGLVLVVATIETSHALAFRDGLTGLPGRRAFDDAVQRLSGVWTVAMVDIDRFKQVNDTHGHEVGDQVLRMVAAELTLVGGGGRAYRYGGEEFAVLFPGRSADEAAPHLEALRAAVAETPFVLRAPDRPREKPEPVRRRSTKGREVPVTVSIGYADGGARQGAAAAAGTAEVVSAADEALYRAKQGGRNRVEGETAGGGRTRKKARKRAG